MPRRRAPRGARRPRVRRRPGVPPAHGDVRLPLLPSGPDGVRRLPLRRAWPPAHPRGPPYGRSRGARKNSLGESGRRFKNGSGRRRRPAEFGSTEWRRGWDSPPTLGLHASGLRAASPGCRRPLRHGHPVRAEAVRLSFLPAPSLAPHPPVRRRKLRSSNQPHRPSQRGSRSLAAFPPARRRPARFESHPWQGSTKEWRRGWDSNPRGGSHRQVDFESTPLRPLRYPSARGKAVL